MQRDRSRDRHFFDAAAVLAVVAALDHGLRFRVFEAHRAVRAVAGNRPRSRGGLNRSRVPVGVVAGNKRVFFVFPDRSVLIQIIGRIRKRGSRFRSGVSVPDVVESIGIFVVPERRRSQFRASVVAERVILRRAVAGSRTRERTPERVADVSALRNERRPPLVRDAREQIPFA